jgi:serine/threonine protein kinase
MFCGKNTLDQLEKVASTIGSPRPETIRKIPNLKARQYLEQQPDKPPPDLSTFLNVPIEPNVDSIMRRMLDWDPDRRPTCEEILGDAYLADLHESDDEPTCAPVPQEYFEYERRKVDGRALEEEIFRELLEYHPKARQAYLATAPAHDIATYPMLPLAEFEDDNPENELPEEREDDEQPVLQSGLPTNLI